MKKLMNENLLLNILEDHPENDESILLSEKILYSEGDKKTVRIHFVYGREKFFMNYEKCKDKLIILFNTLQKEKGNEVS